MKFKLTIFPAAESDVDIAAHFIARDNLSAAMRFYDAIESIYLQIRDYPLRWPRYELEHPRLSNLRRRAVISFPGYRVFYRVDGNAVEVIRVLHGARDIAGILAAEIAADD